MCFNRPNLTRIHWRSPPFTREQVRRRVHGHDRFGLSLQSRHPLPQRQNLRINGLEFSLIPTEPPYRAQVLQPRIQIHLARQRRPSRAGQVRRRRVERVRDIGERDADGVVVRVTPATTFNLFVGARDVGRREERDGVAVAAVGGGGFAGGAASGVEEECEEGDEEGADERDDRYDEDGGLETCGHFH